MSWYNSSADAKKLGLTVRGFFTAGVIAAIVLVVGFFGIDIDVTDIDSLINSLEGVVVGIAGLVSAVMILIGGLRKIYNKITKK